MKWMQYGRAAVTFVIVAAVAAGMVSCTNTKLGYLFVTAVQTGSNNGSGQVYSFRVDSEAGALTKQANASTTQNSPTGSGGANPQRIVLASGGQFLYVLNTGSNPASISFFTVGGDGTIFLQPQTYYSQGTNPQDIHLSSDGNFLYVADQINPYSSTCPTGLTVCGDITVFTLDQTTGKLTLVTNSQVQTTNPTTGQQENLPVFPVGVNPYRIYSANGYVYALDNAYAYNGTASNIFVYQVAPSTSQNPGELILNGQSTQPTPFTMTASPVAVTGQGTFIYVADALNNVVWQYSIASGSPATISGDTIGYIGMEGAIGPTDIAIEPQNRFLYVSASDTSQLVGYSINTSAPIQGGLQIVTNGQGPGAPVSAGTNPQCIAITGGREFIYTANLGGGTVSGYQIDNNTGQLRNNITSVNTISGGQATCLVFSSRTN